jgi:AbrB family looped-hinge helix DNA binding protein
MRKMRLSSNGRITVPKAIRDARGWVAGTEFIVDETARGVLLLPTRSKTPTLDEVFGSLQYKGRPKSLSEMDAAITAEVKARHARGRY